MIYFIEGTLISKVRAHALVETHGVGYEIAITLGGYEALPLPGKKVRLYTYHHVREDAQQLFGFLEEKEREFFSLLISVSGVGPKVAMNLLGAIRLPDLRQAIYTEDASRLSMLPGIGKKTSERIILELKGKVQPVVKGEMPTEDSPESALWNEALLALLSLGYNHSTAQKALKRTLQKHKETESVEELVRKSLNHV